MGKLTSTEWALASRPVGMPKLSDFQTKTAEVPEPADGEIQVMNTWMSVDPYMRGRMYDRESYVPPFQIGETLQGGAVGRVTASAHPDFKVGDLVSSFLGWRTAWTAKPAAAAVQKLPASGLPESAFLGVAGMPGLTAYAGLLRVAEFKPTDTVFVSGAAGAVGSTVVQIAKIKGATVIGSAGGAEKCALVKSLGADHVIDYKQAKGFDGLVAALKGAAPKGIDVYFDNVGGEILDLALARLARRARVVICGAISQYNTTTAIEGPKNYLSLLVNNARMEGFVVFNYMARYPEGMQALAAWVAEGKLKSKEDIVDGIETFPETLLKLFSGENFGKLMIKAV